MSWVDQTDIEQVHTFQHYQGQSQSQRFAKLKENAGSHCDVEFIAGSRFVKAPRNLHPLHSVEVSDDPKCQWEVCRGIFWKLWINWVRKKNSCQSKFWTRVRILCPGIMPKGLASIKRRSQGQVSTVFKDSLTVLLRGRAISYKLSSLQLSDAVRGPGPLLGKPHQ